MHVSMKSPASAAAMPARAFALLWASSAAGALALSRTQPARAKTVNLRRGHRWHDASFFNAFTQAESTYDDEMDYGRPNDYYIDGWAPHLKNPYAGGTVDASFFHESPSGGPDVAWQTHSPVVGSALPWSQRGGGSWKPGHTGNAESSLATSQANWWDQLAGGGRTSAGWFEAAVDEFDAYGRKRYPANSPRRFVTWQERAVNTTLTCVDPGCQATASLQAFNGNVEQARNCKLSVFVKPTDFERSHSTEAVEWISVNGANISLDCKPNLSGCNTTAPLPFFPCVQDVNIDKLITSSGTLQLAAKISQSVDECPYQGNLLYAVPMVTCLVADQQPAPYYPHNNPRSLGTNLTFTSGTSTFNPTTMMLQTVAPLKCQEQGCKAAAMLSLNTTAMTFSKCTLTVKVNTTDFDNKEWKRQAEMIEFIKVEGADVPTFMNPKLNPCRERYAGNPVQLSMIEKTVVNAADVTTYAKDGVLLVEAKISRAVDECAMEGNLLDGIVNVSCSVASTR